MKPEAEILMLAAVVAVIVLALWCAIEGPWAIQGIGAGVGR